MQTNVKSRIDAIISDLESKLNRWKSVRDAVVDDSFRDEMMALLAGEQSPSNNGSSKKKRGKSGKRSLLLEKLQAFFRNRDNEWATLVDIEKSSGLKKPQARQLLYISHVEYFERQKNATGDRQTKFRLKESAS